LQFLKTLFIVLSTFIYYRLPINQRPVFVSLGTKLLFIAGADSGCGDPEECGWIAEMFGVPETGGKEIACGRASDRLWGMP